MRGGNIGELRKCCARRLALAAMIGGLWSLSSDRITQTAGAADDQYDQYAEQSEKEQSVLITTDKARREALPIARDTNDTLEPIANVSKRRPDLAGKAEVGSRPLTSSTDSTDVAAAAPPQQEALGFRGVTPGVSSRRDVLREWGDPRNQEAAETLLYSFDKLRSVRVKFDGDEVDAIVVELASPLSSDKLASKLGLEAIRPALLEDKLGDPLALAFPERGVVLRYAGDGQVGEIVLQTIRAASFLLRAENNGKVNLSACLEDLHRALDLDRTSAHARWLLSDIYLTLGQAATSERYAAEAVEIDPVDATYRLQHAKCLRRLARYDVAISEIRKVLESSTGSSLIRAQAIFEMSQLVALGSSTEAQRSVLLLTKAIEIADHLTIDDDIKVSQQAKQLLVEAHLAMAVEIARGQWARENQTVPQWIERASALSEEMIATDTSNLPLRLEVAVSALAAAVSLETPIDPLLWIEEAEETVQLLRASTKDKKARELYDWRLGLAYFHGAQVQHRRSEPDSAERLAKQAVAKLGDRAKRSNELPDAAYLLGRLYFQIGAIHAVHRNEHKIACEWYDQAVEYLLDPVPVTTLATPQEHGDALVSMGVSYWNVKRREDAIYATQLGVELIESAVQDGLLEPEVLVVPYGNLSAMHDAQGESEQAAKYAELAKEISDMRMSSNPLPEKRG